MNSMKNQKSKKVIAVLAVLCSALLILALVNEFFGNPVSLLLSRKAVEKYIEETYPDKKFFVEKVIYDFKNMEYMAEIISSEDPDIYFYISTDALGRNIDDNYNVNFDEDGNYDYGYSLTVDEYITKINDLIDQGELKRALAQINFLEENYSGDVGAESAVTEYYDSKISFDISFNCGACDNEFYITDKSLASSEKTIRTSFGIIIENVQNSKSETIAVFNADYSAEWSGGEIGAEIIDYQKDSILFEVYYPPVGDAVSYMYKADTKELIELQKDTTKPCGEWHIVDDKLIGGTQALSVDQKIKLYAYKWNGDLLYTLEDILSGYTISDEWLYFAKVTEKETQSDYIVYKMKLDGTEISEYYSVCLPNYTDFAVRDGVILWWENGEETAIDLFTLQPVN